MKYVSRLAPSPTGALHLGNARTFLVNWLRCRSAGGTLLMRMEDLDHPRVKPETAAGAYRDLAWLGLDWDAGPPESMRILAEHGRGPRGEITEEIRAAGSFIQSQRLELYREAFRKLKAAEMIYPCVCSRRDIEAAQSAPHAGDEIKYANTCRDRFADEKEAEVECGKSPAWRFWVSEEFDRNSFVDGFYGLRASCLSEWSGDFVIARGESLPSYQLAVVVDDAAMGVTEVVRAEDLLPSTHRQLAFYKALGLNAPEFYHLPLVVGEDGRRLAKRHGDTRLSHIREAGTRPETVLGWLAHTCGWAEWGEEVGADELLKRYDPQTIPSGRVAVDEKVREHFGVG